MPVPAPAQIDICNEALADIRATLIQDVTEQSNEANLCALYYPKIVSRALEGPHHWSFANQRVQLAQAATNDRPYEWGYAYLVPQNMAAAKRVLADFATLGYPLPATGEPYTDDTLRPFAVPYIIQNDTIYCNAENAWLEYTINDIDGIVDTNLFAAAVAKELAAKLAIPIKGDSKLAQGMMTEAELAWQRAVAADNERQPQTYGNFIPEAMLARHRYNVIDDDWCD